MSLSLRVTEETAPVKLGCRKNISIFFEKCSQSRNAIFVALETLFKLFLLLLIGYISLTFRLSLSRIATEIIGNKVWIIIYLASIMCVLVFCFFRFFIEYLIERERERDRTITSTLFIVME